MADEILNGIKSVFKHDYDLLLSPNEIYERMRSKGFFKSMEYKKAIVEIRIRLQSPFFYHRTIKVKGLGITEDGWALARHFRTTAPKEDQQDDKVSELKIGEEFQRTISATGTETENGIIPLLGEFDSFFASMDAHQQRQVSIDINYYASEHDTCWIEQDNNNRWFLRSEWLKKWYLENQVSPGDKIWLVVENVKPLAIRIYTEWERNPDTYRRHRQLQSGKPVPSVDIPIRDIIWDFLEKTQKIEHRLNIGKAILEMRPEISEQSIFACLSANPHLFIRVGEGFWGLKEWGLDQVVRTVSSSRNTLEKDVNPPTETVPLDYILANIASENLVYRILKESTNPLKLTEITEKISRFLGVNKDVLARATFFDPSDPRYYRQENGAFTLRESLEEVVHNLAKSEIETRADLEKEIRKLQTDLELKTIQFTKQIMELEEEQEVLRKIAEEWADRYEDGLNDWDKKTKLISDFLSEVNSHLGNDKIKEIIDNLRKKRLS